MDKVTEGTDHPTTSATAGMGNYKLKDYLSQNAD